MTESNKTPTLADEIAQYAASLEDIAERWGHDDRAHTRQVARRLHAILAKHPEEGAFTADEVIEIANETSDSFGNLYRLDFINRIRHEARASS